MYQNLLAMGWNRLVQVEDWIAIRTLWIFDWEKIEVSREESRYKRATILLEVQLQHGFQHWFQTCFYLHTTEGPNICFLWLAQLQGHILFFLLKNQSRRVFQPETNRKIVMRDFNLGALCVLRDFSPNDYISGSGWYILLTHQNWSVLYSLYSIHIQQTLRFFCPTEGEPHHLSAWLIPMITYIHVWYTWWWTECRRYQLIQHQKDPTNHPQELTWFIWYRKISSFKSKSNRLYMLPFCFTKHPRHHNKLLTIGIFRYLFQFQTQQASWSLHPSGWSQCSLPFWRWLMIPKPRQKPGRNLWRKRVFVCQSKNAETFGDLVVGVDPMDVWSSLPNTSKYTYISRWWF